MEIIHVVLGKANPERMNGVNKVVYQLATKQVEYGEKVSVWGITSNLDKNYGTRNFETKLFLKKRNPFSCPNDFEKEVLSKKGKAIFHIHGGWIPVFYTVAKILHKHQLPFVFTPHGAYNTIAMYRSAITKKMYFQLFEKPLLKFATKIHCIGKSEVSGLELLYKNSKTILIPYGFENEVKIASTNEKNKRVIFGFIGRLDIYTKGLDTLIEAFARVVAKVDAELWIVGDSEEKEKLTNMVMKHNIQNQVTLFGSKFGQEKEELLKKMDIFVHPSRNEGLPTSVIEAASYGKPCIVTDATNIGDLIAKYYAGEVILNQSVDELEKAMQNLVDKWTEDNNFQELQKNAVLMVKENFNWQHITKEFTNKLYTI